MMKKILFTCAILLVSVLSRAQQISIPWTCGFEAEETVEMSQWVLNPGTSDATDLWTIGNAGSSEGMQSLYISTDGGTTVSKGTNRNIVMAYRLINLPVRAAEYFVSFDYRQPSNEGTMYVFLDYASTLISGTDNYQILQYASSSRADGIPTRVLDKARWVSTQMPSTASSRTQEMRNTPEWCNVTIDCGEGTYYSDRFTNSASKRQLALVFVWINKNNEETEGIGACIDNITIVDNRACGKPQALTIYTQDENSLVLNWQGDAEKYEVGCYSYENDTWHVVQTYTNQYVFTDVPEGFTDFYVRTICWDTINGENFFSAKTQASEFIYYPGNHCVDYFTLTDDNCYISSVKTNYVTEDYKYVRQMVDEGSDSKYSRHTHHYSKTETDPRTGGRLHTVPEGEIASMRLGNWNNGGQSECVEFNFHVDAVQNPILVMKYAVVLESPVHDSDKLPTTKALNDPRFTFDILRRGRSIGPCASADYNASWERTGWNDTTVTYVDEGKTKIADVVWKDWTTVGVNLADYDGEELTIRLSTFDCSLSAHFGYAYFTLGCSDGKIKTNDNNSFEAPDGFNYRWYLKDNPDVTLATTQAFYIDSLDSRIYNVDVISLKDSTCYFTLEASSPYEIPEPTTTPVGIPVSYTKDSTVLDSELVTLHLPIPPIFEGFTFVKWIAVSDDVMEGIEIQAVYSPDEPTSAPAVVANPSNPAQKLIREGNVYILRGDKTYTITGQLVK